MPREGLPLVSRLCFAWRLPLASCPDVGTGRKIRMHIVTLLNNLNILRSMQPLHPSVTRKLDSLYHLDASKEAEIRAAWYYLGHSSRSLVDDTHYQSPSSLLHRFWANEASHGNFT